MEMTAESEAVMAATLANGGVCPINGERVMRTGNYWRIEYMAYWEYEMLANLNSPNPTCQTK